jgi:hypothetical protein
MSEQEPPNQLSPRTTPTWEVELLISGIAVFAMLQLPGWLDDRMFEVMPRLDASWAGFAELLYFYAKSASVILAATFVIHLLLRARWTALVGMHSVYPGGVLWDKLRMGPVQREIERRNQISTEDVIERADNLATTVFAIGVMLAMVLVLLTMGVALVMGTANVVATSMQWEGGALKLFFFAFACLMLPYGLVVALDRRFGARWKQGGWPHRAARAMLQTFARIGMRTGNNRIRALLASNDGDRRIGLLIFVIIGITIGMVMLDYWGMRHGNRFGNYAFFPGGASTEIDASHYDDQRNPARDPAVPYVRSMVAEGPYLQLVVPYRPQQDGVELRRDCLHPDSTRDAALLACLQAMRPVSLDGKRIAGLRYEIASDARTRRPALLAMFDIRALATGRHELRVGRATIARAPSDAAKDEGHAPPPDAVIPFWR